MRVPSRMSRRGPLVAVYVVLAATAASATGCAHGRAEPANPTGRLYPIFEGDKIGYIDRAGRIVVPPTYAFSLPADFVEGRARVVIADQLAPNRGEPRAQGRFGGLRVGFIDATGRLVIEPVYDDAELFSEGLAVVGKGGRYGYVDAHGDVRIPLELDSAHSFSEGLAQVRDARGVRFIDQTGRTAIDMNTVRWGGKAVWPIGSFSEGVVSVSTGGSPSGMGLMDRTGRVVVEPQYVWVHRMYRGNALVTVEGADGPRDRTQGLIDRHGTFLISARYRLLGRMTDGLAWFQSEDGGRGFLNAREEVVIEPVYGFIGDFSEGLCPISRGGRWAYIDREGREVLALPPGTGFATSFVGGLALVHSEKGWSFIRRDGTPAFDGHFVDAREFVDGLAPVIFEGGYPGYVNLEGRVVYRSSQRFVLAR